MGQRRQAKQTGASGAAWQVSMIYLIVGLTWILLTGWFVGDWAAGDSQTLLLLETYKGYVFITATSVLIFFLVQHNVGRVIRAQERRRESEAQFRNAFENAVTGMALMSPELRFIRVNRVLCQMLGRPEDDLLGRYVGDLVHPADRAERIRYLESLLRGEPAPRQLEVRYLHEAGGTLWVLANSTLQRDAAGQPLYFVSQFVDVTALHQAEEQARRQQLELARAARLLSLNEVSSSLAHELKQPLGAILHYGETCQAILQEHGQDHGNGRQPLLEAMDDIVRQAERANQILQRVRSMARKQTPHAEPASINEIVRDTYQLLEPQLKRHRVTCRLELSDTLPPVGADRVQIGQVLVNLVTNAIEAVAEQPGASRWVLLQTREEDDRVWVGVRDGGGTLSDETAARLFESYFTTKEHGLGLGLAISKTIIEAHGGRLMMRRGEGWTEFGFSLLPATKATWLLQDLPSG